MKWKNRLTNYNFWISIVSAVLLILQAFKFEFDIAYINEIATAVLGLLVVIGIISDPTRTYSTQNTVQTENKQNKSVEKIENKKQEQPEEKIEEVKPEVIQLPIETETEDINDNVENDFQALINKISADINANLERINEIQNSILNGFNTNANQGENVKTEIIEEVETNPTCINIVNN